jgi:hypothetical protein
MRGRGADRYGHHTFGVVSPGCGGAAKAIRLARSETQMTDGRWGTADVTHVLEPLTTPITNHPQRICDEGIRAAHWAGMCVVAMVCA